MAHSPFVVHWDQGSLTLPLTPAEAEALQQSVLTLRQAWQGSPPHPTWEHQIRGAVFLEVYCNPNIWATPHAAHLLLTLKTDQVKVSLEVTLPQFLDDLALWEGA